jgi:hypothetical protein
MLTVGSSAPPFTLYAGSTLRIICQAKGQAGVDPSGQFYDEYGSSRIWDIVVYQGISRIINDAHMDTPAGPDGFTPGIAHCALGAFYSSAPGM